VRGDVVTRRAAPAALAALFLVVALPAGRAGTPSSLRQQAQQLNAQNTLLASRSRSAVLTLYALDSQLARAQAELGVLRSQVAALGRQRVQLRQRLAIARQVYAVSERRLAERLRAIYEQGDSDPLSIVLGARTLDEAISSIETVNASAATDRSVVAQVRATRSSYLRLQRRQAARAAELGRLQANAAASATALSSARSQRVSYLEQLTSQRALNRSQIGSLESRARAIQARAEQLAVRQAAVASVPAPLSSPAPAPAPSAAAPGSSAAAGRTLTVVATAYTLPGNTATGAPVGYGVVAVDPSVIPLGTRLSIPGYGEGVAADTGGAIQGAMIDLWFPNAAAASAWGRRTVTITLH
jgi:3D (Asp-Asp-Asp) domain-containing protein/septal ring factor EnvC (AmiA/AmiB activator)